MVYISGNFCLISKLFANTISSRGSALTYCFWYVCKFGCFEARSIAERLKSRKLAQIAKTVCERASPTTHFINRLVYVRTLNIHTHPVVLTVKQCGHFGFVLEMLKY